LLSIQERALGPEHLETLATRADFAYWTHAAGDQAEARAQYDALGSVMSQWALGHEQPGVTVTTRRML
jgi:hypothetical protein